MSNVLYFFSIIDSGGSEFLKIGVSSDLRQRKAQLQNCCPFPLTIKCAFILPFANVRKIENIVHKEFLKYKVQNEWFILDDQSKNCFYTILEKLSKYTQLSDDFDSFDSKIINLMQVQKTFYNLVDIED